ncbi:MAG: nucleotidyltransferase domain-containing protein [Desulfovibrionaceae bacterium]
MSNGAGLPPGELALLREVFARHPRVDKVVLFGSRAKGTARPSSDVDLAVTGSATTPLAMDLEALALDLDELPLPYRFDLVSLDGIRRQPLAEHIGRVGVVLYERGPEAVPERT